MAHCAGTASTVLTACCSCSTVSVQQHRMGARQPIASAGYLLHFAAAAALPGRRLQRGKLSLAGLPASAEHADQPGDAAGVCQLMLSDVMQIYLG